MLSNSDELITTKIFVKLLINNILANRVLLAESSSGSFNNFKSKRADFLSSFSSSANSLGASEKKAFSAAEVTVEIASIIIITANKRPISPIFEIHSGLINKKCKEEVESGSNDLLIFVVIRPIRLH